MARYRKSFQVRAPQDRVYARWLNAMNELVAIAPQRFRSFRVIEQGNGQRLTECVERWAGRDLKYRSRERLTPPSRAEQEVVEGHSKGSRTTWAFQSVPEGTQVDMDLHLRGFEGFILGVLMRGRFRREMDETLALWSRAIENPGASRVGAAKP